MISIWEIPLIVLYLAAFIWVIAKVPFYRLNGLPKNFLIIIFLLKVIAGTILAAVYFYYYTDRSTADIYKYFDDSKIMTDALWSHPGDFFRMLFGFDNDNAYFSEQYYNHMNNWFRPYESNLYNDSHTIIRINAVMRIVSFGSYHVHTVFACFLSLTGLTGLYKSFVSFCSDKQKLLAAVVFLLPSVMFWASGVLKESFLIFGLGILFYSFIQFSERKFRWRWLPFTLIAFLLLLYLKVYVLMALLPGMIAYFWVMKSNYKLMWLKYGVVLIVSIIAAVYFEYIFPDYHMLEIFVQKQQDFIRLGKAMNSGSQIVLMPLTSHWWSFLQAAPHAFYVVMFRPFIWESTSPFMLLAGAENLLLITGVFILFFRFRKPDRAQLNLVLWSLSYVILLFVLIGWVTPVLGAVVRYKVPALPFLGMILVVLYNKRDHSGI